MIPASTSFVVIATVSVPEDVPVLSKEVPTLSQEIPTLYITTHDPYATRSRDYNSNHDPTQVTQIQAPRERDR